MAKVVVDTDAFLKYTDKIVDDLIRSTHKLFLIASHEDPEESGNVKNTNGFFIFTYDEYCSKRRFSKAILPRLRKLKSEHKLDLKIKHGYSGIPSIFKQAFNNPKDEHLVNTALATKAKYIVTDDGKVLNSNNNGACQNYYHRWGIQILKYCKPNYHQIMQ